MPVNVISTENMTYSYTGVEAISDISFAVKKGDYLGIVGPNGSGKSTLVKNILGILPPQKGFVYLFGQLLSEFRQRYYRLFCVELAGRRNYSNI